MDVLLWAIPHLFFLPFLFSLLQYNQALQGSPAVSSMQSVYVGLDGLIVSSYDQLQISVFNKQFQASAANPRK